MKQVINELIQLQDLHFTLQEQKALAAQTHLQTLEESISSLMADLPDEVRRTFTNLLDHYPAAIVPMDQEICSGCGMAVPTIMAYEVKVGDKLLQCPRCTRYLYYMDDLPRQPRRVKSVSAKPPAGIARFSSPRLMMPQLQARDRDSALEEMIQAMAAEQYVEDPGQLLSAAISRELIVPTAIEHGLAFPHVRGVEGGGLVFSVGLKKQGLKFGAPKNRLTKIIFFLVIPHAASAFYLQLIAGLMESLRTPESRNSLLECTEPEQLWTTLGDLTKKHIS